MRISKAYGGVTMMVALVTGNCLVNSDIERLQRVRIFDNEFMDANFTEAH